MSMLKRSLVIDARMIRHSGIGVYLKAILPFIQECGKFQISLLCNPADQDLIMWDNVELLMCDAPIYSIREQVAMHKIIPPCDIFWSPHYNVPLLPVKAGKRLVTIHDVYHLAYLKTLRLVEKIYARTVLPLATRLSRHIITDSEFSKSEIMRYTHVNPRKISVIPCGVSAGHFRAAVKDTALLQRYGLDEYLLFVGNVKPHKNISGLIEAFGRVHESYPGLKLVIIGKKDNFITGMDGLKEQLSTAGLSDAVVFTGFVTDEELCALYKTAAMLVFPSFYEGFGLPPLEAMAAGIPVVASTAASIPEVCGDAVWYVDPHNPNDIAHGIRRVLEDHELKKKLVSAGGERVNIFSWHTTAEQHIDLLTSL